LLTFTVFLEKLHSEFFKDFESKQEEGLHSGSETDIKHYIQKFKKSIFDSNLKINFRYFVKWDMKDNKS